MVYVHSKALNKVIQVGRIIGHFKGTEPGPTLIFIAGIHGNEPSGVFALHQVIKELNSQKKSFKGNLYAIAGNLKALETGIRYQDEDLNRAWGEEQTDRLNTTANSPESGESLERFEIYKTISEILRIADGPFFFIDLHTTSSETKPFITVNDNLLNRKFTQQYPVPLLLGIEEYLEGTLLNYINAKGYVAFGFESGQHDALSSIKNHVAFVYLTLKYAGCLSNKDFDCKSHYELLVNATQKLENSYEIIHHHKIKQDDRFIMRPGFQNFETVKKGEEIADSNGELIKAPKSGLIFMPLYQKQGEDGFFIIKSIPTAFLSLSAILRQMHFDYVLPLLPGISWVSKKKDTLKVDLKTARFFAKKLFHLLGYRSRQMNTDYMIVKNRETISKKEEYKGEIWYQ